MSAAPVQTSYCHATEMRKQAAANTLNPSENPPIANPSPPRVTASPKSPESAKSYGWQQKRPKATVKCPQVGSP